MALVSSLQDIPVPRDICFAGEVGLSGEIRPVQQLDKRIAEATRLGYKKIYIPVTSGLDIPKSATTVVQVQLLRDLFEHVFG